MAWNRPSKEKVKAKGEGERRSVHLKGLFAGAIVVVGAAVATWWIFGRGPAPVAEDGDGTKKGRIREVTPAKAATNAVARAKKGPPKDRPRNVGEIRDGFVLLPNGHLHKVQGVITSHPARVTLASKIFTHTTDITLASFLTTQPGTGMIGRPSDYYRNFEKAFRKSLKDPIVIDPKDSDEAKDLKQGVIELRDELVQRMNGGEDLTKLLQEEHQKLFELSSYRADLEKQVDAAMKEHPEFTEADLDDLVNAANGMLKDRGITPIKLNKALKNRFKMYRRKANRK